MIRGLGLVTYFKTVLRLSLRLRLKPRLRLRLSYVLQNGP
jgi:hypothetical protein